MQDLWGALTLEVRVTPEAPITTTPGPCSCVCTENQIRAIDASKKLNEH